MRRPYPAVVAVVLAMLCAVPAVASPPYVTSEYYYDEIEGGSTFVYRIQSLSYDYLLNGFHVYAPVDPSLLTVIKGNANGVDWRGTATLDSTGCADVFWQPVSEGGALSYADSVRVQMWIGLPVECREDYTRTGYLTNWGYGKTLGGYASGESTLLMVPQLVPEPSGIAVLLSGALAVLFRRRR